MNRFLRKWFLSFDYLNMDFLDEHVYVCDKEHRARNKIQAYEFEGSCCVVGVVIERSSA